MDKKELMEAIKTIRDNFSKEITDEVRDENEMALDVISEAIGLGLLAYEEYREKGEIVPAGSVKPGSTIRLGGVEYEVLDNAFTTKIGGHTTGVFCLSKEILFNKAFDEGNCNDWRKSSLREYLNGEWLEKLSFRDKLMKFERDLTSDDGLKDYGSCEDTVSLISDDEYRRYRYQISNKKDFDDGWGWWTLTPYSTPGSGYSNIARRVSSDGSRNGSGAYSGYIGVAPAFVLSSSFLVEIAEGGEVASE